MTQTELEMAENMACGEDFCHVCSRATDHWGEHTPEQIEAWAEKPGILQDVLAVQIAELP